MTQKATIAAVTRCCFTGGRRPSTGGDDEHLTRPESPRVDRWIGGLEGGKSDAVLPGDGGEGFPRSDPMGASGGRLRGLGRMGGRCLDVPARVPNLRGATVRLRRGDGLCGGLGQQRPGPIGRGSNERIGLRGHLPAEEADMVGEHVDPLEQDGIRPAEVVEFVLLLVAEHPLGIAPRQFDLGIADAIGGGLIAELAVVLGAAEFEIAMVMVEGQDLIREPGPIQIAERKVGVEVLGIGFEGAVVALAGVVPAALVRPAEAVLKVAFPAGVACGAVQPVATGQRQTKDREERPDNQRAAASARMGGRGRNGGRAAHGSKLTGTGMDFKQRLRLSVAQGVSGG